MTASKEQTRIIRVSIKKGDHDVFIASSPTMKGLLVVSQNFDQLLNELVPQAIADLFEACGQRIIVSRAEDPADHEHDDEPFVVMPVAIARHALQQSNRT